MFYPLIKALDLKGWVDLFNFPPSNWQGRANSHVYVSVVHPDPDSESWLSTTLQRLSPGGVARIGTDDVPPESLSRGAAFLFVSREKPAHQLLELPAERAWVSNTPAWRATVGLQGGNSRVSYQGEVEPFPEKGSLLSFHPFLQFSGVRNYLLTVSLQTRPNRHNASVEIYRASTRELVGVQAIVRNGASVIPLDGYGFTREVE